MIYWPDGDRANSKLPIFHTNGFNCSLALRILFLSCAVSLETIQHSQLSHWMFAVTQFLNLKKSIVTERVNRDIFLNHVSLFFHLSPSFFPPVTEGWSCILLFFADIFCIAEHSPPCTMHRYFHKEGGGTLEEQQMTHDVEKKEEMDGKRLGLGLQSIPSSYVLFFNICVSAWSF